MKIELYHDILARKVFEKASAEEKMRLKVERFVHERYSFYLENLTGPKKSDLEIQHPLLNSFRQITTNRLNIGGKKEALLVKSDLEYIDPFLDQLLLSNEQLDFIKDSRRNVSVNSRQRRIVLILLIMSIASTMIAIASSTQARQAKINIELLDFVNTLSRSQVISRDVFLSAQFQELQRSIEGNNSITSNEEVMVFLEDNDVLSFKDDSPPNRQFVKKQEGTDHPYNLWSKEALSCIDWLSDNLTDKRQMIGTIGHVDSLASLSVHFNDTTKNTRYQFPYTYYGLYESVRILKAELRNSVQVKSIEKLERMNSQYKEMHHVHNGRITAMAVNPKQADQYAGTDASGRLFVRDLVENLLTEQIQEVIYTPITTLAYSKDGKSLYVGTVEGTLYLLDLDRPLGSPVEAQLILKSPAIGPIRFIVTMDRDRGSFLMVGGTNYLGLWERRIDGSYRLKTQLSKAALRKLKVINTLVASDSRDTFIVGGGDHSLIMSVDFNQSAFKSHELFHPGHTVTAAAIGVTTADYPGQAVALGTETGEIWLTTMDSLLALEEGRMDILHMSYMRGIHDASITGLIFNKTDISQLISSSLDGNLWMFNLALIPYGQHIYPLSEHRNHYDQNWYDHLKLRTDGSGISKICLMNKDDLLVVENNSIRKWSTNIGRMRSELVILLKDWTD